MIDELSPAGISDFLSIDTASLCHASGKFLVADDIKNDVRPSTASRDVRTSCRSAVRRSNRPVVSTGSSSWSPKSTRNKSSDSTNSVLARAHFRSRAEMSRTQMIALVKELRPSESNKALETGRASEGFVGGTRGSMIDK